MKTAEETKDYKARYYREHPEKWAAYTPAYTAAYRAAHQEQTLESARRWRKENPDAVRVVNKKADAKRYAADPARYKERNAVRRALKAGVRVERVDRRNVYRRDAGVCGECWEQGFPGIVDPQNWHLDHVIPLARGGEHSYANTQVTHPLCNLQKGAH